MVPDAPLAHAFVAAADIRTTSPKSRADAEMKAEKRGAERERQRILAIISAPEAEHRHNLALHIALKTDMSPEQARELLEVSGMETT